MSHARSIAMRLELIRGYAKILQRLLKRRASDNLGEGVRHQLTTQEMSQVPLIVAQRRSQNRRSDAQMPRSPTPLAFTCG